MKKLLLNIFAVLGVVLFYGNNAYADDNWTYITNPTEGYRGFRNVWDGSPQFNKGSWLEAYQVPSVIIGRTPSPYWVTYLTGVTYAKSGVTLGDRNNKYNVIETIIRYEQAPNSKVNKTFTQNIPPVFNYTLNNSESHWTICQKYVEDALAIEWYCRVETSNYDQITAISIDWGRWDTDSQTPIAYICSDQNIQVTGYFWNDTNGCNDQSLVMKSWRYKMTSTQDPTVAGQQTIINQNQTIINQNNQINQNIEDIHDAITDSNVSGNFNLQPVQPFGPIGQITNAILGLPLILVGVGTCNDVVAPLPYINENLTIPCPHKWLPQMSGQLLNTIDVIMSAGIYFTLARYIFKKVQNLRDPENDDEEYLDI